MKYFFLFTFAFILVILGFFIVKTAYACDYLTCYKCSDLICSDPSTACPVGYSPSTVCYYLNVTTQLGTCCSPNPTPTPVPPNCYNAGGFCTSVLADCINAGDTAGDGPSYSCTQTFCCLPKTCSQLGGSCNNSLSACLSANDTVYDGSYLNCGSAYCCVPNPTPVTPPTCTTNYQCTACTTNQTNTCSNNGTQSCTYTGPSGCKYNFQNVTCSTPNCSTNYTCSGGGNCVTNIYAYVYTDYNHDGILNGADAGKQGVTVNDGGGGNSFTTDATGKVTFSSKVTGTYTINMVTSTNFLAIGPTSQSVSLTNTSGNQTVYFHETPLYQISGTVFVDTNKNLKYDTAIEPAYTNGGTITVTGGPTTVPNITVAANGTWTTPNNLESGTYTVSYSSTLAAGYTFTTPSTLTVTVGDPTGNPACNGGSSLDAICGGQNSGSISGLNFGVTNDNVWSQSVCMDVRNDSGTYSDPIPASPSCGGVTGAYNSITNTDCSSGAGIIFSCGATPNFGLGTANANNWQAGGTSPNNECFTGAGLNVIRTSYDYLLTTERQSNITPIDMTTVCGAGGLANCTLPTNLAKGVYLANGDVTLTSGSGTYTFPVDPTTPQGFIFLINGNLTIDSNIIVPAGSVAAFSASSNIYVDPSVGNVITNPSDPAVNDPNIEGLYSADANFIIQSYGSGTNICNSNGTPLDKKLNIVGSVITNAAMSGGSFQNNRDLCIYDTSCPAASVGDDNGLGLSYLLTLFADGGFLNHKTFNWQELRP